MVAVVSTVWGDLNHANLNVGLGPLGYVLNSPRMHLWHHDQSDEGGAAKNFGDRAEPVGPPLRDRLLAAAQEPGGARLSRDRGDASGPPRRALLAAQPARALRLTGSGKGRILAPQMIEDLPTTAPAFSDESTAGDDPKRRRKEAKLLARQARPLDPWERYRTLVDALEEGMDLVELADRKARFALVIMGALNIAFFFLVTRVELIDVLPPIAPALPRVLPADLRRRRALLLPGGDRGAQAAALPAAPALPGRGGRRALPRGAALLRGRRAARPRGLSPGLARGALRAAERRARGAEPRDGAHQQRQVPLAAAALRRPARADAARRGPARRAGAVDAREPPAATRRRDDPAARAPGGGPGRAGHGRGGRHGRARRPRADRRRRAARGLRHRVARGAAALLRGGRPRHARRDRPGRRARRELHRVKGNLEDVAVHTPSGRLVLLAEKKGELVVWDPSAASEIARFPIDVAGVLGKEPADRNQGFEGLAFREESGEPGGGIFYLVHQRKPARLVALSFDPTGPARTIGAADVVAQHALKPYEDLTAVTWSEPLGRLLVIAESDDRLLLVSPAGTITSTLAAARRPSGGPGLRRLGRAVDRRRPPGAVQDPRRARRARPAAPRPPRDGAGASGARGTFALRRGVRPGEARCACRARRARRVDGRALLDQQQARRVHRRAQGLSPGRLPLVPGLAGGGRQRRDAARRRVRVAAPADRLRGQLAQAGLRARRRPGLRRGRRAQGRAARAALLEGAGDRRRPHEAAGEPGVADLGGEDRRHRARGPGGLDRSRPRLGRHARG